VSKFIHKQKDQPNPTQPSTAEPQHCQAAAAKRNSSTQTPVPPAAGTPTAKPARSSRSRQNRSRPLYRRPSLWIALALAAGLGTAGAYGYALWQQVEAELPESVDELATYTREGTMTVKAADGTTLQEIGPVTHQQLEIDEIPNLLVQAFIASEDRRFLEHNGVDLQGILRATIANLRAGGVVEGGSTITQQVSRVVFLTQERDITRKLKEIRIAQMIEASYDKEEILNRYLNLVYLGSGAYGVGDAAWVYFGKSVQELTLAEAALIAGIAPAPSAYSPLENKEAAKAQRDRVLRRMEAEGYISAGQAALAAAEPLNLNPQQPKRLNRKVPYFTDYIQRQLPEHLTPEMIQQGGLTIETTLDLKWQQAAEDAVAKAAARYGDAQGFQQAALVAIDPRTGEIKAMVGGKDYFDEANNGQFNRVTQAKRQPGSTFKTFVYATAMAAGFSPYKELRDAPLVVDGYEPVNYDKKYRGNISLRDALTYSANIPAVRTLIEVGWNPVIEVAQKMGIQSELKPTYSLALGASEVTLLELTSAYGTLANEGQHVAPHGIARIRDRDGNIVYEAETAGEQALDPESAAIVTWMLQSVVSTGTGTNAQLGRPVAGKTGTSDDFRDLWFIGYVPQLVAGVWLGNDDNTPTRGASSTAAAVWKDFMTRVVETLAPEEFPERPENLENRKPTIEPEPIEPKSSYYKAIPVEEAVAPQPSTPRPSTVSRSTAASASENSPASPSNNTPTARSSSSRTNAASSAPRSSQGSVQRSPSRPAQTTRRSAPAPAPQPAARPAPAPQPAARPAATAPAPPAPPPDFKSPGPATAPAPAPAPAPSVVKPPKDEGAEP